MTLVWAIVAVITVFATVFVFTLLLRRASLNATRRRPPSVQHLRSAAIPGMTTTPFTAANAQQPSTPPPSSAAAHRSTTSPPSTVYVIRPSHFSVTVVAVNVAASNSSAPLRTPRLPPVQLPAMSADTCENIHRDDTCPICLAPLLQQSVSCAEDCDHWMHTACYNSWLSKDVNRACPVCRKTVRVPSSATTQTLSQSAGIRDTDDDDDENNNNSSSPIPTPPSSVT